MKTISLNGAWTYRVGTGAESTVAVPFSKLPVGRSACTRYFDLSEPAERVFVKFDGITYYATVSLNGTVLGEMLPYCEYEFEITSLVKPHGNLLYVELEDIDRAFGPSEGWQNYGGIIRDVSLLLCNEHRIRNVFFRSVLEQTLTGADMTVTVDAECAEDASLEIRLLDQGVPVLTYHQMPGESKLVHVEAPKLWSPEQPTLYALEVNLLCNGLVADTYQCAVGFRAVTCDAHRFFLNGKPLFLKGVCKHEMVGDSGHCPTPAQIEADLQQIKAMGCNFVRLVHYPHNKITLDIADRLGILVSEEPGLWWSDTANEEISQGSLEVLRRTILRDRNHPSIAFWLCFNECIFTEEHLIKSAAVCRELDPTRLVSGANCMSLEDTLLYYNKCGFDFYTMHPYSQTFDKAKRSAEVLCDKPLLFTEWGGYFVYDNPHLLLDFMTEMKHLYREERLAGAFFWFFAELEDYNRGEPACTDGMLHEGLVDQERRPTRIYDAFCKGLRLMENEEVEHPFYCEESEGYCTFSSSDALCGTGGIDFESALELVQADASKKGCKRKRTITHGPRLHSCEPLLSLPKIAHKSAPVAFVANRTARAISIIGLTALIDGYPLGGAYGEAACRVCIQYQNGKEQTVELQNGVHITVSHTLNGSSRINPTAALSKRFMTFGYDRNFEQYTINRFDIPTDPTAIISRVEFWAHGEYLPLIYGVFAIE